MPRKAKRSDTRKSLEQKQRMQQRPRQAEKTVTSLRGPVESVTSIKCPTQSVTSIKVPTQSVTSIKGPENKTEKQKQTMMHKNQR